MPNIKYYQSVADIKNHYRDILQAFEDEKNERRSLKSWIIKDVSYDLIKEEADVVRYLVSSQLGFSVYEEDLKKPTLEAANRCFTRQVAHLNEVFGVNADTYKKKAKRELYPSVVKEYMACIYYLEKFQDEIWLNKMPDEVLTLENRKKRAAEKKKRK